MRRIKKVGNNFIYDKFKRLLKSITGTMTSGGEFMKHDQEF